MNHPETIRSLVTISANLDPAGFTWTDDEHTTAVNALPPSENDNTLSDRLW